MKTVQNKTRRPLRVPLPRGKSLHLGPGKTGQVSAEATDHPAFKKLVEAGELEVLGDGATATGRAGATPGGQESTHGHPQTKIVMPKGNR